jgi:hypothetical protein
MALEQKRKYMEFGWNTYDMSYAGDDTVDSFPLRQDKGNYATASIHFRTDGVFLTTTEYPSAPTTQKVSDWCIPAKYRKLFTNIPGGFVPMPAIHQHVKDTLRLVVPLLKDDLRKDPHA